MASQGEKRSHSDSVDVLEGVKVALLDVEGTLTPLSFAKDKLYPYVKENLQTYLENHWDNEECQADVTALRKQSAEGETAIPEGDDNNRDDVIKAVVANVIALMDGDKQSDSLKALQLHMYREAFKTGKVQGEVFDDVVGLLKKFSADGVRAFTFSSCSTESQKLIFGYSEKGDLSEYFSGYFDSETGSKTDKGSYAKIASEAGVEATQIMFFTDLTNEAAAACEAGLRASLVEREGAKFSDEDKKKYNTVCFAELLGEAPPAKKAEADGEEGNGAVEDDEEGDEDEAEEA